VDGQFQARIALPDGSDQWEDWFSWQDEGTDWRRKLAAKKRKSAGVNGAAADGPARAVPGGWRPEEVSNGAGASAGASADRGETSDDEEGLEASEQLRPPAFALTDALRTRMRQPARQISMVRRPRLGGARARHLRRLTARLPALCGTQGERSGHRAPTHSLERSC